MWRPRSVALVLSCVAILSACGGGGSVSPGPSPSVSRTTPMAHGPSATATASCAQRVLDGLTLDQRVGQLFLLGLADDRLGSGEADAIRSRHFGSVWFIQTTSAGAQAVREVADQVQALATGANTGSVGFFVAANQEGGLIQALRGPGFSTIPSAVEQGQLDPTTLQKDAKHWGRELVAAGVNMDFAPVMDVVPAGTESQNQPIGALMREYGHDPEGVARQGTAFLRGMAKAHVATSAKHFPGLGRVIGNTDDTAGVVDDVTTTDDPYLAPFHAAIADGVPFVMVALARYTKIDPDHLAAFSPVVIRQLLRRQLGFRGVVLSDDLGETKAVADVPPADRAISFLRAGGDLIISKTLGPAEEMASALVSEASGDSKFRARVAGAALSVLEAKQRAGLLPCGAD